MEEILDYTLIEYHQVKITIWSLISIILIYLGLKFILRFLSIFIHRSFTKSGRIDKAKEYTILQICRYILYTIAIVMVIQSFGFDISKILVASAALLVGVGLGLQEVFRDIFSGIVLLFEGTFKVGDVIEINGIVAQVKKIDLRTSKVETRDGTVIIVPNSKLVNENIINWSLNQKDTRFAITVGVAYGSDTEKVRYTMAKCVRSHPSVSKSEAVMIFFEDFGDSALVFSAYFWTAHQWNIPRIKSDIRFSIDKAFRDEGIQIPFPQRDLHIISDKTQAPTKQQQAEDDLRDKHS